MADAGAGEKLKVFISYSRRDLAAFADELVAGLELGGFAPFLDRHDIAPGEPWEVRLGGLIEQSDTVVFVVSPEAVSLIAACGRWIGRLNCRSGSCRLSSNRSRSVTYPKSSGVCNSSASTARRGLRGDCRSWRRRCGSISSGFGSSAFPRLLN